jgi:hypothetical protein
LPCLDDRFRSAEPVLSIEQTLGTPI